jgi:predicted enzyme related to lactoylglutathione lyase
VQDLDEILDKIEAHGGRIVLPRFHIDAVGHLSFFEDTERNRVGVMQYEPSYRF